MSGVCLSVIFNHKYNKNLVKLEKIYGRRFSKLYYMVPFYDGEEVGIDKKKIISVQETSFCFQGYVAQAFEKIKDDTVSHYVFIGDDQILNPDLNEFNLIERIGIDEGDSYIKEIVPYDEIRNGSLVDKSNKLFNILMAFRINNGVSYQNELPTYEQAVNICKKHGLRVPQSIPISFFLNERYLSPKNLPLTLVTLGINGGRKVRYPLYKGYSDMFIINRASMKDFCRISGVLAAMNVFVETAIPLAMILSCESIRYESDLNNMRGIEYWGKDIDDFEKRFNMDLDKLFKEFGNDILYYHPVKLSKWRKQDL